MAESKGSELHYTKGIVDSGTAVRVRRLPSLWRQGFVLALAAARREVVVTTALVLLSAIAAALRIGIYAILITRLVELDSGDVTTRSLLWPMVGVGALFIVEQVVNAYQATLHDLLSELVAVEANRRIIEVSTAVDLLSFESPDFYDQLERAQTQVRIRPTQIITGVRQLGRGLLTSVGILIGIAVVAPILIPLIVVVYIPVALALWSKTSQQVRFFRGMTRLDREAAYLVDLLTSRQAAKEIRSFAALPELTRRYERLTSTRIGALRRLKAAQARTILTGNAIGLVLVAMMLGAALYLFDRGSLSLGSAAAAVIALRQLTGALSLTGFGAVALHEAGAFLDDYTAFVDLTEDRPPPKENRTSVDRFDRIAVERVGFTYPGSTTAALEDVTLDIEAKQSIAIVGRNGSGKTTLAKILTGLYPPTTGRLLIDGAPAVPGRVAILFQDSMQYALSAQDNIAFGVATDGSEPVIAERIRAAARAAGADTFIEQLDLGYETRLTRVFEDGTDLSEGQWQRVALARAFFRDAELIVLDEPSTSLDPEAEAALFETVTDLRVGKTVIFISHRFSTVRMADHIVVMDGGRVVEQGTHDSLVAAAGLYADLYDLQAGAYR